MEYGWNTLTTVLVQWCVHLNPYSTGMQLERLWQSLNATTNNVLILIQMEYGWNKQIRTTSKSSTTGLNPYSIGIRLEPRFFANWTNWVYEFVSTSQRTILIAMMQGGERGTGYNGEDYAFFSVSNACESRFSSGTLPLSTFCSRWLSSVMLGSWR